VKSSGRPAAGAERDDVQVGDRVRPRAYSGADGVAVSGGGDAYASVYAPRAGVTVGGGSTLCGAVLGRTLTLAGTAAVHHDVQLLTVWAGHFNP
jgi:hypothetical protein